MHAKPFYKTLLKDQRQIEQESVLRNDNYFLELQDHGLEPQKQLLETYRRISKELGIALIASNDVHYLDKEDAEAHDILLCIQTGKNIDEKKRLKFSTNEFYFKSFSEMAQSLQGFEDAIANTVQVADRCNYDMEFGQYKYPLFQIPEGQSLDNILTEKVIEGFNERMESALSFE